VADIRPKLGDVPELIFEAEISPGMSSRQVVHLARIAEEAGFDRLGISDVVFWPDCFVLLGLVARETSRIQLGPMVTNPYSRHPAVLAGVMATLQDASEGRAFLGIGVGAGLEALGETYERPVARLRETIEVVQGLLAGDEVNLIGSTIQVSRSRMVGPVAPVPIAIGSRRAQVMRLAGAVADTALVGGRFLSPAIADQYRTWIAEGERTAGRAAGTVEIAPRLTLCISDDGDLARRSVKRYVAHYVSLIQPVELDLDPAWLDRVRGALSRSTGWYFDLDRHDDPEIDTLISDDLVRRFAVAGTADECVGLARDVLALGFTSASFNLAAPMRPSLYEGLRETLEGSAAFVEAMRR
jgi:5,10-methylenetetrahydromethanopterin reductase